MVTEDGPLSLLEVKSILERLPDDGLPAGDIQTVDVVAHGALDLQSMQAGLHQEAAFAKGAEAAHRLQVLRVGEPEEKYPPEPANPGTLALAGRASGLTLILYVIGLSSEEIPSKGMSI